MFYRENEGLDSGDGYDPDYYDDDESIDWVFVGIIAVVVVILVGAAGYYWHTH
jgi:hypothetical protein